LGFTSCRFFNTDAFSGSTLIWKSGANNYFNRESSHPLDFPDKIPVTGEVEKDEVVEMKSLPWRSVAVKEAVISGDSLSFKGAYRYDGYALCDILSNVKVDKWKKEEFYPPVDLYVEVWNDKGEVAVFSWGELFYSADPYNIIIAKNVTRVIPGKTKEMWKLPVGAKLVAGGDRYSERNILNPSKIVIRSLRGDFKVDRDPEVFISNHLEIRVGDSIGVKYDSIPRFYSVESKKTLFYGQSMGYKGEKTFKGVSIASLIDKYIPATAANLRGGIVCIEATDGYRAAFSLSELINRADFKEPLVMSGGEEKGRQGFSLFCPGDMFADRAIKSVNRITLVERNEDLKGNLIVFHAGSLSMPFKVIADSFMKHHPKVRILAEASGSLDAARKITELKRDCDIVASADYTVIDKLLIPEYAVENIKFATNEMAIVFNDKSKHSGEIDTLNWLSVISGKDVSVGRSDPDSDPCGYRTLLTLELAKRYYSGNPDIPGKIDNILKASKRNIRPKEVDLLALLDAGAVDYIFLYKSVAIQHGLRYLELPERIDLGNPLYNDYYAGAEVKVRGSKPGDSVTMRGEAMVYGITQIKNAPNKAVAEAFIKFVTSEEGRKILDRMGQGVVGTPE
jgi:molybdate/tungstate transport system substrate-binding protein